MKIGFFGHNNARLTVEEIKTLYAICEGFNISLEEFFSSPLFARENIHD